jgi:O-antigen/teichoic acid export membrane protein
MVVGRKGESSVAGSVRSVEPQSAVEPVRFGAPRLFRDAASLASSSAVNAAAGLVVWAITARLIEPASLGVMTAVLAAITAPAIGVATMVGDAYAAFLPAVGLARPAVFRRGQRMFLLASTFGGLVGGVATITAINEVRGSIAVFALVAVGTVLTCASMLQITILASIGRAHWLLPVTLITNLLKVAMLWAFALTFHWHSLELASVISAGLVALSLAPAIQRIIYKSASLPENGIIASNSAVQEFNKFLPRSLLSTLLGYAIFYFTPFLVTAFSDPKQGALFALALPVAQTVDMISTAMGTSLVVHGATQPGEAGSMARSALKRVLPIAALGAVSLGVLAPILLRLLNAEYGSLGATAVIAILCAASVVRVPFSIWAALQRSRRNLRPSLIVTSVAAVVVSTALPLLAHAYGARGGALGLLAAYLVLLGGAATHILYKRRTSRGRHHVR